MKEQGKKFPAWIKKRIVTGKDLMSPVRKVLHLWRPYFPLVGST